MVDNPPHESAGVRGGKWVTPTRRTCPPHLCGCVPPRHSCGSSPLFRWATNLSTEILTATLPGLVESPPGTTNGALTPSNIGLFTTSSRAAAIEQQMADGNLNGYTRSWTREPPDGNGIVIVAFGLADPSEVGPFLGGVNEGIVQGGGTQQSVSNPPGATGFSDEVATSRITASEYFVTFARGNTAFVVESVSATGTATSVGAVAVAAKQAAFVSGTVQTPEAPGPPASYVLGEVIGYVVVASILIGGITVLIWKRAGRKKAAETTWNGMPAFGPPASFQAPSISPGWHPFGDESQDRVYWDGRAWTARVMWNGTAWIAVPLVPVS